MRSRRGPETIIRQYGAIPVRLGPDGPEILLVTSRGTGRWIIPKGWPARHLSPADSAVREAFEEAGVRGELAGPQPIGAYTARKRIGSSTSVLRVEVFLLRVTAILDFWPEARQRERRWFRPDVAGRLVEQAELGGLIALAAAAVDDADGDRAGSTPTPTG